VGFGAFLREFNDNEHSKLARDRPAMVIRGQVGSATIFSFGVGTRYLRMNNG
jgi:hypothetical protein